MSNEFKCLDFNRRDCSVHYVKIKSYCPTCFKHYCLSDEAKQMLNEWKDRCNTEIPLGEPKMCSLGSEE